MSDELDPILQRAIELARELPAEVPALAHREQVRTSLLARADVPLAAPRPTRRYAVAAFGAVAAAAFGYLATHPAEPAANAADATVMRLEPARAIPRAHGHVHPHATAVLGVGAATPDEIVQLHDGTIDVEVDPLGAGERFRVIVGGSEIEVRGTAFTVVAERDRLLDVHVAHGRVEVRPVGALPMVLETGATWHAPAVAIVSPAPPPAPVVQEASALVPVPHREPTPRAAPPPPPLTTDQLAYNDAWSALRAHRFHDAAAAFARALAFAPDGPLADDARYWHAVALAREPRAADAIVAFRELLDEHPGSGHHGEASAMLGWLLVDAKQLAEARTRFEAAAADASDDVRASARAGLAALPAR